MAHVNIDQYLLIQSMPPMVFNHNNTSGKRTNHLIPQVGERVSLNLVKGGGVEVKVTEVLSDMEHFHGNLINSDCSDPYIRKLGVGAAVEVSINRSASFHC